MRGPARVAAALLIAGAALSAAPARGTVGVGVGEAPLTPPNGRIAAGTTASTGALLVANTGTEPIDVVIAVNRLATSNSLTPPPAWVDVTQPTTTLAPNGRVLLPVRLQIPGEARPGYYVTDLVATATSARAQGVVRLHAASATEVRFTVVLVTGSSGGASAVPVAALVAAGLGAVALLVMLVRRRRREST